MANKIQWNWGTKLLIAIILFMSFIFVLVYLSTQNNINLVEKDYYPKGLKYQNRIEEIKNASHVSDSFNIVQEGNHMVLTVPQIESDSGTIVFFRPSDQSLDFATHMQANFNGNLYFPLDDFEKGLYIIKIHWFHKAEGYYVEKKFFVK
jgi:hypothetical protein